MLMESSRTRRGFKALLAEAASQGRPVVLDGAVGTELDNRGMDTNSSLWSGLASMERPELLLAVHSDYVAAGAEIITTATFRTTRRAFAKANQPEDSWREAAKRAVEIARMGASGKALVAGCVAPLEDCFSPQAAPWGQEARDEHLLLCRELVDRGVDVLWLETFGALLEIEAAVWAARAAGQARGVPFVLSVTTNALGALISGEPSMDAFELAKKNGAAAFGVNCAPPGHVDAALEELLGGVDLPVGAYANLGFAEENQDWEGQVDLSPVEYADIAKKWADAGVSLIGGCCGSTPAHIEAVARLFF